MTLKASNAADIVAYVPHLLGFTPADSAVLIAVHEQGALGATLRIDLPSLASTGGADYAASLLRKDTGAVRVLVVIYDEKPGPLWGERPEYLKLSDALEDVGLTVQDGWVITAGQVSSLLCTDPTCCPATPLDDVVNSVLNAELISRGSAPRSQAGLTVPPVPAEDALERMHDLITERMQDLEPLNGDPMDVLQPAMVTARLDWECALGQEPNETHAAVLLAHLARKQVRDRLVGDMIGAPAEEEAFRKALIGQIASVNWDRAENFQRLALHLLTHAPVELRAELLTMVGYIEWYKGRSSTAWDIYTQAQEAVPGHRLSTLLLELTRRGIMPVVAQSPATAYKAGPAE